MNEKYYGSNGDNALILNVNNQNIDSVNLVSSSFGEQAIDVSKLYSQSKILSYDPALMSTAFCSSKITYIDGAKGILRYRGYTIEELATKSNFLETAYLLIYGDIPSKSQLENFLNNIKGNLQINQKIVNIVELFPQNSHPMSILISSVASLSSLYHEHLSIDTTEHMNQVIYLIMAKVLSLSAMVYRYTHNKSHIDPNIEMNYMENFVHMIFGPSKHQDLLIQAIDVICLLHADHEQNASTAIVRMTGSTGADPLTCISNGMSALWGIYHGGANEAVVKMLQDIDSVDKIPAFIQKVKTDPKCKLMGFGHRIYKNFDPRAKIIKELCTKILDQYNSHEADKIFNIAMNLEQIALNDQYFISHKLYPNVDFYSGIIFKAIGLPENMFTVIFAFARTVGWLAQWKESIENKEKIVRPRQLYIGHQLRKYV